jgi:thiamine-monophosphate kinase
MTVDDLGERAVLARVLARLPRPSADVIVGPGDDAAIVQPRRNDSLVVTTDCLVEDVHFSRAFSSPDDIGTKALAVNLSDLAAMGARPVWATLTLALPGACPVRDVDAVVEAVADLARAHGVSIIGGNITRSPGPLMIDITAGGEVRPRRWLLRGGGAAGDGLYVSGTVGGAAAGLEMLRALQAEGAPRETLDAASADAVTRAVRPVPRVRLGLAVARGRAARAAMDLSDGLADAVAQVAAASGCGATVEAERLPIHPAALRWWTLRAVDAVRAALAGGDDYELLFAIPSRWMGRLRAARQHAADPPLTRIGTLTRHAGRLELVRGGQAEPWPAGFEHFGHR